MIDSAFKTEIWPVFAMKSLYRRRAAIHGRYSMAYRSEFCELPDTDALEYRPMRINNTFIAITGFLWLFAWSNTPADRIGQSEIELKQIEKEISSLKKKIQRDEKTLKKERTTLQQTEKDLVSLKQQSAQTQIQIDQARALGESLKTQVDAERARVAESLARLGDIVVSQHATGDQGFLKLLLSQEGPGQIERTMEYYRYLTQMTSRRVADSRIEIEELMRLEAKHAAQQKVLDQLLDDQRAQQQALEAMRSKRQQAIAGLDNRLTQSANRVGRLQEDQRRIEALVKGLQDAARARRKAQAEARAKAVSTRPVAEKNTTRIEKDDTVTHTQPIVQRVSNDGLGKLKGRLKMPVSGSIDAAYGSTKTGSGVKWNGIMLDTRNGAPVRSIYDGQIVYADWFKGFGQLVIVDHGQGYMSLYSHNSQLARSLGEQVKQNDIIAYTGTTGGLTKPGLYFEVRYNGEPRDPLLWVRR